MEPRARISARVAGAVDAWTDALSGTVGVQSALSGLVSGLGADCGTIVRSQTGNPNPLRVALSDPLAPAPSRHLRRTFAQTCFGQAPFVAGAATLWLASDHGDQATGDPSLADWQAARGFRDLMVLVLSCGPQTRDHIELHFRTALPSDVTRSLASTLPDMARVWASRKVALATGAPVRQRRNDPNRFRMGIDMSILDPDNPQRLSRTESRVCLLLSTGLQADGVSRET